MTPDQITREIPGIRVPDSKLAVEAIDEVREASPLAPLFNHAFRTYLFGELIGRIRGYPYDPELLLTVTSCLPIDGASWGCVRSMFLFSCLP